MKLYSLFIFCLLALNVKAIEVAQKPWPEISECNNCIGISISNIDDILFNFPKSKLKEVLLLNVDGIGTYFKSKDEWFAKNNEIIFSVLNESKTTGGLNENGYYQKLNVSDITSFFDEIHTPTQSSKAVKVARQIMGLNDASAFVKYQGTKMNAYWVKSYDMNNQLLYIVPANHNHVIQLSGAFKEEHINRLLSSFKANK
ncbi:hypothetical protein DXX93_11120 [Thalassotalea euphylliae]|uniref:Uncharacterized protein n=1 Tax=Thalassotalea euphylliae TaxID=1655234 RepID=A0A3E0TR72_9GAMM|nr:hypothetical protein [Thalassotalea euphylliae]REL27059.1 hypothetical protein DXX93_11120 [Thalassotalea euphylliae]